MSKAQREKGKRGERLAVALLKELGFKSAYRVAQRRGDHGDADVAGVALLHIEVKIGRAPRIASAMEQAKRDALEHEIPVVLSKKDHEDWNLTIPAARLWDFVDTITRAREESNGT